LCHFISKRCLKVVKILKCYRHGRFIELFCPSLMLFLSLNCFCWKLLVIWSQIISPSLVVSKTNCTERPNKCQIPKFEGSFFYLILMLFFLSSWVTHESIQKMSFFDFIENELNVDQILKFRLSGRCTQLMFFIL